MTWQECRDTSLQKLFQCYNGPDEDEATLRYLAAMPAAAKRDGHPARRTFQAIRIYINGELDGLSQAVTDMFDCLDKGGRVSIITFHSLEDRIVKQAFAPLAKGCICPRNFPVCVCGRVPQAKVLKAVAPSEAETAENPRSRSARLRTAEKL